MAQTPVNLGSEIKLFGKWSFEELEVKDPSLQRYVSLKPIWLPHSGGRHEHQKFNKSKVNVVERLVNNMMRPGKRGGKKTRTINIIRLTFELIHLKTDRNPIEVLVGAIENSAPTEDTTRVGRGGIVYNRAVDISPQRRVDLALRFLSDSTRNRPHSNLKTVEESLADELIAASEGDNRSYAVSKKNEMERVALASR